MISDSVPWREDLLKTAARLEQRETQKRWTERTGFLVERDIMLGAYIVRRLNESRKVSDDLRARRFDVQRYSLVGKIPDALSRYSFWESFDLESGEADQLPLAHLCNQIIHSYVWEFSVTDDGLLTGVYVCSDQKRRKLLYQVPLGSLIDLFRRVGSEDIYETHMRADENGERRIVVVKGRSIFGEPN